VRHREPRAFAFNRVENVNVANLLFHYCLSIFSMPTECVQ
jgi:hypothetical protein